MRPPTSADSSSAKPGNADAILPVLPQSKLQNTTDHKQATVEELAVRRSSQLLTSPYPVETCCTKLLEQFPNRLGLFVAGRPRSYAFRANKIAITDTVSHLGYQVLDYSSLKADLLPTESDNIELTEIDAEAAVDAAAEAAAATVASQLASLPESTLSMVFLRPQKLDWSCLGNCLIFEPYHQPSLFASDKWNMARILSRKASQSGLKFFDATGAEFNYRQFTLYTVNPGLGGKQQLLKHLGVYRSTHFDFSFDPKYGQPISDS